MRSGEQLATIVDDHAIPNLDVRMKLNDYSANGEITSDAQTLKWPANVRWRNDRPLAKCAAVATEASHSKLSRN